MISYTATITLLPAQTGKSLSMSMRDTGNNPINFADGDSTKTTLSSNTTLTELGGGVYEFWTNQFPAEDKLILWCHDTVTGDILSSQTLKRDRSSFVTTGRTNGIQATKEASTPLVETMSLTSGVAHTETWSSGSWGVDLTGSTVEWLAIDRNEPRNNYAHAVTIITSGAGTQTIQLSLSASFTDGLGAGNERYQFYVVATMLDSTKIILITRQSRMTVI